MAGTPSRLGALIKRDPELAKREIFEIAREVGGKFVSAFLRAVKPASR